jgi:hypothetical protein
MEVTMSPSTGELHDYNGPFDPNLKLTDFDKDALVRLVIGNAKLPLRLDGLWYTLIRKRFGEQTAMEFARQLWETYGYSELIRRRKASLKIEGNDVASALKFIQTEPSMLVGEVHCELKNKNLGIATVKRCRALEFCERHGEVLLIKNACGIHRRGFEKLAESFNPSMKITPLKLPPRGSFERPNRAEIACQWQIKA